MTDNSLRSFFSLLSIAINILENQEELINYDFVP